MLKIGLTGGIGSGKSTAAHLFAALGVPIIDSDIIARTVINDKNISAQLQQHFGQEIVDEQGQLNRGLLRARIFENVAERHWLENLLHPLILKEIRRQITTLKTPYCIIVIPLLLEATKPYEIIDRILVVDVAKSAQIERTRIRDQITLSLVNKMLKSQISRAQRRRQADDIITNDSDLAALKQQVEQLHQHYLQLAFKTPD